MVARQIQHALCKPLHSLQHALQVFIDASNEGWAVHVKDYTAKGLWRKLEGKLYINFLELKVVVLAPKKFGHLCWGKTVLISTENSYVVDQLERGMISASVFVLFSGDCSQSVTSMTFNNKLPTTLFPLGSHFASVLLGKMN